MDNNKVLSQSNELTLDQQSAEDVSALAADGHVPKNAAVGSRNKSSTVKQNYQSRSRLLDNKSNQMSILQKQVGGSQLKYGMLGSVPDNKLQPAAAPVEILSEEQIKQEQQRKKARVRQQNELNSRLSVKKSALSKMLDAQKRKERIMNPQKYDYESIDRDNGAQNRGIGGRHRSSRIDGDKGPPGGSQNYGGQRKHNDLKIPDNYKLPPRGKFDREQKGQFQLIFPFNARTEELAFALNRQVGSRASMGAPNFLKMLVQEIKQQTEEYMLFIKSGYRYAPE